MEDLIRKLTEAFGPSGFEDQVRAMIAAECQPYASEMRTDAMGNLIVLKKGKDSSKRIMLSAHMDEIGVMVSTIDDKGFVRFVNIGGLIRAGLLGSRVQFANGTVGVINCSQTLEELAVLEPKVPKLGEMFIDVACKDRASSPVSVGDPGVFARPCVEQNGYMINKAMDDRISCVTEIEALKRLDTPAYDTYFVFSAQEEVGLRGATTAGYGVDPHYAIAVDVTPTRDFPEGRPLPVVLGGGAAIKVKDSGMVAHPKFKDWLVKVAKDNDIRYQLEVLDFGSTDGRAIQLSRAGVVVGVVSIPTRHIHSPSEMVYVDDVEQCVRLIAAVLSEPIAL